MRKFIKDFTIVENRRLTASCSLLILTSADGGVLPKMRPGQFVQVRIDDSKTTFLRRPISICYADSSSLWLLVRRAGDGTNVLADALAGSVVNLLLPLGNGFGTERAASTAKFLLIGGGVGVAPLFMLGMELKASGCEPEFLLGARSESEHLLIDEFRQIGAVHISTDDGSVGQKGVVTQHEVLQYSSWDKIYCCGPAPMMKAVASVARRLNCDCEVSLENMMACGLGACLCCVEKTTKGNVCVCTEGPVFNINDLTW